MLLNGIEYSWGDIEINALGRKIIGVTAASWNAKFDKQNIYAGGNEPIARGQGKNEYDATITLLYKEIVGILDALEEGQDLGHVAPFEVSISFLSASNKKISLTLNDCQFLENGLDCKTGDPSFEKEIPLVISGIAYKK